jgi:hypothetical protein
MWFTSSHDYSILYRYSIFATQFSSFCSAGRGCGFAFPA